MTRTVEYVNYGAEDCEVVSKEFIDGLYEKYGGGNVGNVSFITERGEYFNIYHEYHDETAERWYAVRCDAYGYEI